jgi:hypothetical protein
MIRVPSLARRVSVLNSEGRLHMRRVLVMVAVAGSMLGILQSGAALCQVPKSKDLDRQHDDIVKDFVSRTYKLALQYQQSGSYNKAKESLELILKVAPEDPQAQSLLEKMHKQEMTDNKKVIKVMANQGWQKTGIQVVEGKPVSIEAKGEWVFVMRRSVSADGIEVPEDMKKFPLGALIGVISVDETVAPKKESKDKKERDAGRPFLIGAQKVIDHAPATGMLLLKMHDSEENDNQGQLQVTVSGQIRER